MIAPSTTAPRTKGFETRTLYDVVAALPRLGRRQAVGVHGEWGMRWWSYERLHAEALAFAGRLDARGVGRGDRVVLWAANSPEWVACFLGVVLRGAVAVLVDRAQPRAFAAEIADRTEAKLAFCDHSPEAEADERRWSSLYAWPDAAPASLGPEDSGLRPDGEDAAAILFSSGTTKDPKGVVLSHGNLVSQIVPFGRWRRILGWLPARALVVPPLSHVLGLVVGLALPLFLGLTVIYVHRADPPLLIRVIRAHRILMMVTVPKVLASLQRAILRSASGAGGPSLEQRLPNLGPLRRRVATFIRRGSVLSRVHFRLVLVGGADLPADVERFWRRAGILVVQGYGMTETSALVTISNPFSLRPGSIGQPVGSQEVRLAEDGEILVRGPGVMARYFGDDVSHGLVDAEGFLRTGDLAGYDEHQRLVFRGRKKDMIVTTEGWNVSPSEVENEIRGQPGVHDCVVVPAGGAQVEEVHAVLLLEPAADPAGIVRAANRRLHEHQRVRGFTVWPDQDLPRAGAHKVNRRQVIAELEQLPARAAARVSGAESVSIDEILGIADSRRRLRLLAQHLVASETLRDGTLRLKQDLGLSSLDVVELLAEIETVRGDARGMPVVTAESTLEDLHAQVALPSPSPAAGSHASGGKEPPRLPARQPFWSAGPLMRLVRPLTRRLAIALWAFLGTTTHVRWHHRSGAASGCQAPMPQRFILAAEPHKHWLDSFAIFRALPRQHRRVMVVTNRDFREAFSPVAGTPLRQRLYMAAAYYLVLPLLFCFAILPPFGRTREGLLETARLIDRGYNPISFPKGLVFWGNPDHGRYSPGLAQLAIETGLPVVPVHLEGNDDLGWSFRRPRRRLTVHLGLPVATAPSDCQEHVVARVEAAFVALASAAKEARP